MDKFNVTIDTTAACCCFVHMVNVVDFGAAIDRRLDRMIEIAGELDCPLDHVVFYMGRCSYTAFLAFSDRPSLLPRYTKSNVRP